MRSDAQKKAFMSASSRCKGATPERQETQCKGQLHTGHKVAGMKLHALHGYNVELPLG